MFLFGRSSNPVLITHSGFFTFHGEGNECLLSIQCGLFELFAKLASPVAELKIRGEILELDSCVWWWCKWHNSRLLRMRTPGKDTMLPNFSSLKTFSDHLWGHSAVCFLFSYSCMYSLCPDIYSPFANSWLFNFLLYLNIATLHWWTLSLLSCYVLTWGPESWPIALIKRACVPIQFTNGKNPNLFEVNIGQNKWPCNTSLIPFLGCRIFFNGECCWPPLKCQPSTLKSNPGRAWAICYHFKNSG